MRMRLVITNHKSAKCGIKCGKATGPWGCDIAMVRADDIAKRHVVYLSSCFVVMLLGGRPLVCTCILSIIVAGLHFHSENDMSFYLAAAGVFTLVDFSVYMSGQYPLCPNVPFPLWSIPKSSIMAQWSIDVCCAVKMASIKFKERCLKGVAHNV